MNSLSPFVAATQSLAAFEDVESWVFDLDNTLYPRSTGIDRQMDVRIRDFVAATLGISPEKAHEVQKGYYRDHGTTLRGLMNDFDIEPGHFLDYVHDLDYSSILPNRELKRAIAGLPGRKFIFTNGSHDHAVRVVARLGIAGLFDGIFDIVAAGLNPKPGPEAYDRFLAFSDIRPERAAMFEDLSRNLKVPHGLGMRTVLVECPPVDSDRLESFETRGPDADYVDFTTRDLAGFVGLVAAVVE